ncbi:MAG: 6-phosphofructokinase [Armatimonadota bacterium]
MPGLEGNAVIGQSGGPTMVINASLVGAIQEAKKHPEITGFYGALNGVEGVLHERLVDLYAESEETLEDVRYTPSAAIGSVRLKVNERDLQRALDVFRAHNVRYFFYAGGNDSQKTSLLISEIAKAEGYDLICVGIPKTVDNDLPITDHCPGYGSVARFVASAVTFAGKDNEALRELHLIECMGRDSGWITAASRLARRKEGDPPHLILLPEVPFNEEQFIELVLREYKKWGRCVVAVSEGIRYADKDDPDNVDPEALVAKASQFVDQFGHPQLGGVAMRLTSICEERLGMKTRNDKMGTLQRSFMFCASKVDLEEAYEVGRKAVELAAAGQTGQMVTLQRTSSDPYEWTTGVTEFENVAEKKKDIPLSWIDRENGDLNEDFVYYLKPLVEGAEPDKVKFGPELPYYPGLKLHRIEPRLGDYVDSRGWWLDKRAKRWIRATFDERTERVEA